MGQKHSEETKRKLSQLHIGRKHSEETKDKISKFNKGNKYRLGQSPTKETKQKISESLKGRPAWNKGKKFSEETRKKMSLSHKGEKSYLWNGGLKSDYTGYFYELWRNKDYKSYIKERDNRICNFPNCGNTEDLVLHHVNYDKRNSAHYNLITLCRGCNTKVNCKRNYWKLFFISIMRERHLWPSKKFKEIVDKKLI